MADIVNRSGTLVGSVLETGGYLYQSVILDSLQGAFTDQVGGLLYLFAISLMIFQFAVTQKANGFMWLFIGPPLFFAVTTIREPIDYARWSFGSSEREQGQVNQGVTDIKPPTNNANVSKVFKSYVTMISATTTSLIDTIIRQDNRDERKEDLWFLVKGELYGALTTYKEDDPGLIRLIQKALIGDCRKAIQYAKAVDDPFARLDSTQGSPTVWASISAYASLLAPTRIKAKEQYETELKRRYVLNDGALKIYIEKNYPELYESRNGTMSFSCQEYWTMAYSSILQKSGMHRDQLLDKARELGIEEGAINNLWEQASGEETNNPLLNRKNTLSSNSAEKIARVIAKYYLRNESNGRDKGSIIAQFVERNDVRKVRSRMQGYHSYVEQARLGGEEWSERERLIHTTSALPYYQGLALYFLGMTFPFFAFLLLIPGKMGSFTLWFLLWLWIKSWDVGLAVVMQIDDILWSFFSVQRQAQGVNDELSNDFETAMISLQNLDPSFQMAGYYTVLGVCMLAIPPVSAQLILGSIRGGASAISAGVSRYSDFNSDAVLASVEQSALQRLKYDANLLKQEFAARYHDSELHGSGGIDVGNNPALSYMSPGGQQNVSFPGRSINQGQSLQNEAKALNMRKRAAIAAMTAGTNFLGGRPKGKVAEISGAAATLAGIPGKIHKLDADVSRDRIGKERKLNTERAAWDGDISDASYDIHERMALYQAIPVPWTNFMNDEVWKTELDKSIFEYQAKHKMAAQGIEAMNSTLRQALKLTGIAIDTGKNSMMTEEQKIQKAISSLNDNQREKFMSNLMKQAAPIAGLGILGSGTAWQSLYGSKQPEDPEKWMPEFLRNLPKAGRYLGLPEDLRPTSYPDRNEDFAPSGINPNILPDGNETGRSQHVRQGRGNSLPGIPPQQRRTNKNESSIEVKK
jgi:hypothetical protein